MMGPTKPITTKSDTTPTALQLQDVSPEDFADVKPNRPLLRQVILGYQSNQRQARAHTKTRSQVKGGGRKPWRQKGTGRARTGSIRNPIWRGGGIIFGPLKGKNYTKSLSPQLKRQALKAALAIKVRDKQVKLLKLDRPFKKTRDVKVQLPQLFQLRRGLVVVPSADFKIAFQNLPNLTLAFGPRVNALDLLSAHQIVFINDTYERLVGKLKMQNAKSKTTVQNSKS